MSWLPAGLIPWELQPEEPQKHGHCGERAALVGRGQGTACSFPDALGGRSEEGMAAPTRVTPGLGGVQSGTL